MPIVVVSGLHRSGTSMMMSMLKAGGFPVSYDNSVPTDEHNPNGYYELYAANHNDWSCLSDGTAVKVRDNLPSLPSDLDLRVLLMRRNIEAVVDSWRKRRISKGQTISEHWAEFCQGQLDASRAWLANHPHIEVWYEDVLRYPANECLRVCRFLDYPLDLAAMAAVIDPSLNHHANL